jgi:hypothetical protein
MYTVQLPSEDVTTVRPSELEVDMLVEPLPGPAWVVTDGLDPVVVEPDTLPPPAVTCELILPAEADDDEPGAFSPGFRCTVLQLLLGPDEEEETRPSDDEAALDELELSAWAAKTAVLANAAAQNTVNFMVHSPGQAAGRPRGPPSRLRSE